MKLSEYAKKQGITYQTALKWIKNGKFPCRYERMPSGTIIVHGEDSINGVAIYGRVSSHDQKHDLERQLQRLRDYTAKEGLIIIKEVGEIASGLNDNRKGLNGLLRSSEITTIIVEHRDRLARFGTHSLEAALNQSGRKLIILNDTENNMDIVQDFVDVVTSMCARIYGKRAAKNKAKKMLEIAHKKR